MKKYNAYKIAVIVLSVIVVIQAVLIIALTRPKKEALKIKVPLPAARVKIAIVIDDWGYNLNNLRTLDRIRYPLTMSILPNLSYSEAAAKELHRRGFEIILHLPMEPHEKLRLEKNTITNAMNEAEIKAILGRDLAATPYSKGVSNHMGSSATENTTTMTIVFRELKKRGLYFLDSFVSPASVCFDLAREVGVGFARRDVFLDNTQDREYIKSQIDKLKKRALSHGYAIGIGHDRKVTLAVLAEVMPEIEKEGFKFIFVSELVKR